jgi:glycosyltransferase involved in cell wall biosynthesis
LIKALQQFDGVELVLFTDPRWPLHPAFSALLQSNTRLSAPAAPKALIWEQVALPTSLWRERIDVFHAPADGGLPVWKTCGHVLTYHRALDKSVLHWIAQGELPGTPDDYGLSRAGIWGWQRRVRHGTLRKAYLHSADTVVAVSQFGKWELVKLLGVPEEKVTVIPLAADDCFSADMAAADVHAVRRKYGLPSRYLLFVGGFDPWKNVDGLIRAFADARQNGIVEGLVLAGIGGDRDRLRALAAALDLKDPEHVVFLDRVHVDLAALYHGATAFITLSWGESFSLPVLEAMSCGTPVIASQYGAIPEVMDGAGIVVDPRNAGQVRAAMLAVSGDEQLRSDLRTRGLNRAKAFSWRQTAERTLHVYRGVVGRSASAGAA